MGRSPSAVARQGEARVNLLAPSGLHFGQAKFAALARDPATRPVIDAATALMRTLITKTGR